MKKAAFRYVRRFVVHLMLSCSNIPGGLLYLITEITLTETVAPLLFKDDTKDLSVAVFDKVQSSQTVPFGSVLLL